VIAGLLLGLGASVCWAVANVAIQRAARAAGILVAIVWSQVAGCVGLAPFALLVDRPAAAWTSGTTAWTVLGGLAACVAYFGLFYATAHGRLSIVVPIVSSWALLSTAIGLGILGEAIDGRGLAGAAVVVAGVVLVARASGHGPGSDGRHERRAVRAAAAAALGFGTLIPAVDQEAPAAGRLGAVVLVLASNLVVVACLARVHGAAIRLPPRGTRRDVLIVGILEAAGFACASLAAAMAPLAIAAPAASVSAPVTTVWAWLVLGERPGALAGAGAALSAVGVLLLAR
jgi:drug/metabolite transporter (DMT)-like permease